MHRIVKSFSAISLTAVLLGACANNGMGEKQVGGGLLGAAAGGLVGSQFGHGSGKLATTALGTLFGAYLGSEAGKSLDKADRQYAEQAEQKAYAAPVGQTIRWNNPQSGNQGSFTPVREGTDTASGAYCREYQTTIVVGGQTQQAYGTACRQPDGSWKVVK
ncbi:MAG TPA: glycine zipper 2TM domain-containing protein [Rhodospirillaceae bacterium]|nr:glycine zipper 2TM domain-containing protein [Rhodospirillaceae bacterium]